MKLRRNAQLALRGCSVDIKKQLAKALKVSLTTVHRCIRVNDDSLTKAAAMAIIRPALGLDDSEILENETEESQVKEPQS